MTEKYNSELFSRIKKLNFASTVTIKQTLRFCLLFLTFFIIFFGIGSLVPGDDLSTKPVEEFFCTGFSRSGLWNSVCDILSFSRSDFNIALIILASGYTMMATPISACCIAYMGAKNGYCFSYLWRLLIDSHTLSSGPHTFAYLAICKTCVLVSILFLAVCAGDFSYRYSDLYRRSSRPFTSPQSINYALISLSGAGLTALFNMIFMTFQYISPLTRI